MLHLDRPYSCPDDEARDRMRALSEYWRRRHGLAISWDGDRALLHGKVKGVKFDARVTVSGGHVRAEVEAGFLAEKLGGRAYVERRIGEFMDPKHSLEELRARG